MVSGGKWWYVVVSGKSVVVHLDGLCKNCTLDIAIWSELMNMWYNNGQGLRGAIEIVYTLCNQKRL